MTLRATMWAAVLLLLTPAIGASAKNSSITKVVCFEPNNVLRTLEIDYKAKSVRHWARFTRGRSGPFGPYKAEISPDKVSWVENNSEGNVSYYTLDRKKKTLDIKIDYGPSKESWLRLDTQCDKIK
jgi:hypothetical protein